MRIDLSPGDWTGVYVHIAKAADQLRESAVNERNQADRRDLHEQADDLMRIAGVIRKAIADDGQDLPELAPGEPEDTVTCQHVMSADDIRARIARNTEVREHYARAGWSERSIESFMRPIPDAPGAACDLTLWVNVTEVDCRGESSWTEDGSIYVGKHSDTEHLETRIGCEEGHDWQMPDVEDWG